ncbi:MFS transporter [Mumia sp. Pv 4-285]|uniref:MFS transporter n=1 Tax=Mumia qirimensis TaxID=3234852 RepID=UPI00351D3C9C
MTLPSSTRTLGVLFVGAFVMGSSELLVVGVLTLVADDLAVSVSSAGSLVTGYALGLAFGGPLLTALTIRLDRRTILCAILAVAVACNLVVTMSTSYEVVLVARILTGALAGLFDAAAFAVAVAVVPPERTGRALAVVISGVAVSTAVGVPLGTLLGQAVGWRGAYAAVVVLMAIALAMTAALVPGVPSTGGGAGDQARYAFAPRVLSVLLLCALVFASTYAALTYIVPFLSEVTGVPDALISVFLLAYGIATAVGAFAGGRYADRHAGRTLIAGSIAAAGSLGALYVFGDSAVLVAVFLLLLGVCAMGMGPSLQHRVVALAGRGGQLAQSLPASAINLGVALGSAVGGISLAELGPSAAILSGLVLAAVAIPVAWATNRLQPPRHAAVGLCG